jgi:hypothetical protein
MGKEITVELPCKFKPLLSTKKRYKVFYGGRGGAKTYSFALAFIILSLQSKIKVICCREIMQSIEKSVYAVLLLTIDRLGIRDQFNITESKITCKQTGSTFIFAGLFRNIESIKSIPEITHVWINEGDRVSEESLQLLFPTIREDDSEIWIEFNPNHEDDAVYQRFILNPPPDALVVKVNWQDNPFISNTLKKEMETDYAIRPEIARHIWEGELQRQGAHVWACFDPATHIKEFDFRAIKDYKIFQSLDPHTSYYSASLWIARWKEGDRFYNWIFKEWPSFSTVNAFYSDIRKKLHYSGTVKELATQFYAAESGLTITSRFMDTYFAKGFGSKQSNLINNTEGLCESFARPENGGMRFMLPQEVNIDNARDKIKTDMRWNTLIPRTALNEPCLYVSANCKNVIRALKHHRYEDDNERESETYKDFSDVIRIAYAGMGEYRWPVKPKARPDMAVHDGQSWMGS